jgi:hypothetical protein
MDAWVAAPDGERRAPSGQPDCGRVDLATRDTGKRIHAIGMQETAGMRISLIARYKKRHQSLYKKDSRRFLYLSSGKAEFRYKKTS